MNITQIGHRILSSCAVITFLAIASFGSSASAAFLGFETSSGAITPGNPTSESGFVYDAFSGGVFSEPLSGNPGRRISGLVATGGGVLQVVRSGGGLFKFDQVDVTQNFTQNAPPGGPFAILFRGFLGGALVQSDTFTPSSLTNQWTTVMSVNLLGVVIDELRIFLDATALPLGGDHIDNLGVFALMLPEPTSLALMMIGLVGVRYARRTRTT